MGPLFPSALKSWQKCFQGYGYYSNYFSNFFFERNPFFFFFRAEEWCEGGEVNSGGKPSFWQENRDTFKMSNYGWGVLGRNLYSKFPRCFQSVWPIGLKCSLGSFQGGRESFSHACQPPGRGTYRVVLMRVLGDPCLMQIPACFLWMCHRPPPKSR